MAEGVLKDLERLLNDTTKALEVGLEPYFEEEIDWGEENFTEREI